MSTKKNIAPEFTDDVDKVEQIAAIPPKKTAHTAVKFVKSPMGYNLSYNIGDVAELPEAQADYLIKLQIAELC